MGLKPACFGAFSTTFRFPKSELPSTHGHANAKNIHILENFCRSDENLHFGEFEPNIRKIGNTHQDTKNVHTRNCLIITPLVEKNFLVFTRGGGAIIRNHVFVKNKAIFFGGKIFFLVFTRGGGQLLGNFGYFGKDIYFLQEKKICASFPKNIRMEKIGDLTMKA